MGPHYKPMLQLYAEKVLPAVRSGAAGG
jgi:hypothetical protein